MNAFYDKLLKVAIKAAVKAGRYLRENFEKKIKVEHKGEINLVTEQDRRSQEIIRRIIQKNFPRHSILGEEDLEVEGRPELQWLIDPIDGTTNFAHNLPIFCVSIALMEEGESRVGVVYNPMLDEMFWSIRGRGAFMNKKRVRVSTETRIGKSLLATGFPYDLRESSRNNLDHFNQFIRAAQGIRRCGAAAIDLCYVAAGRFDGFWELKLYPWDTAAGYLMIEEAGGKVTDFSGGPFDPFKREILASNGKIHRQMLDIIKATG